MKNIFRLAIVCALAVPASAFAVSSTNAVEGANTFGLLKITNSVLKTVPVTVNFGAVAASNEVNGASTNLVALNVPIAVSNIVKTAGLAVDDKLYAWNAASNYYDVYKLVQPGGTGTVKYWEPQTTTKISSNGVEQTVAADAGVATQLWGAAVWVVRASTDSDIYVFGQVNTSAVETVVHPGNNLVGAPTAGEYDLNGTHVWPSGIDNCSIKVILKDNGAMRTYLYKNSTWGFYKETTAVDGGVSYSWTTTGCSIPAGTGFWILNKGSSDLTIKW